MSSHDVRIASAAHRGRCTTLKITGVTASPQAAAALRLRLAGQIAVVEGEHVTEEGMLSFLQRIIPQRLAEDGLLPTVLFPSGPKKPSNSVTCCSVARSPVVT